MCNKGVTHLVVPSKRGGDSNNGNFFPQNPKNFKTQDIYIYIYIYIWIWNCNENSTNNMLKLTVVSILAIIIYGHNFMSIIHRTLGYITFIMKVVAMTLSRLASSVLKQQGNHNTLNYTIWLFYEPPITEKQTKLIFATLQRNLSSP
jgi:hypothetical protein